MKKGWSLLVSCAIGLGMGIASRYGFHETSLLNNLVWSLFCFLAVQAVFAMTWGIPSQIQEGQRKTRAKLTQISEELLKQYWDTTLRSLWGPESKVPPLLRKAHIASLNRKNVIEKFLESGQFGHLFVIKCNLREYGSWACNLVQNARSSIYSTNTFFPKEFFEGQDSRVYLKHLEAFYYKELLLKNKRRLQIIPSSKLEEFKKDSHFPKFKKYNQEKVEFRWTTREKIERDFLGDYLIVDKLIVLRYHVEHSLLELMAGDIVNYYLTIFKDQHFETYGTWDDL